MTDELPIDTNLQPDAEADEGRPVGSGRLVEVAGDDGRHRLTLAEEVRRDLRAGTDDQRDRDRLAQGPAQPQHDSPDGGS